MSKEQKQQLKQSLDQKEYWTVGQVRKLVDKQYGVNYGKRQIQRLLRQLGLYCYKPQPRDYRQPEKADEKLKERLPAVADGLGLKGKDLDKLCMGFADESSPQLHANSARLWSVQKGGLKKVNTDKKRRNCFGFYALKGNSIISSIDKGNQENMIQMLTLIREANQQAETIILIWDNHKAHLTAKVEQRAKDLQIVLVNLPAYSPNLNPIERIWKQIKKTIAEAGVIDNLKQLEFLIQSAFKVCAKKQSFAKSWIDNIWNSVFVNNPIPFSDKL
ncbi:IS630 family transposase [Catalinimonas niigatensis]|uniref:IS630 family transposase n=1 Tax=Catalinimonas niigatensis TaxID=1397264 RepID=UPI00266665F2|nr:IS630 family transposase [Catalinimonas niigatensis]WPP48406.1 IS630 family transposase [Catalinimonas niigatensis]WPP51990.1 IS630 family transposase [Catalinimonas niigatensis]WPP52188.1 IS630 family transposase [Catalinimonas niigatensis]WPP52695.1 IS630 family transposase [Catalinimonas niigatensis]